MMVWVYCPQCIYALKEGIEGGEIAECPVIITSLSDSGEYIVECGEGHSGRVIIDNVKFEILFEMGLNAIVDGYPHQAVTSFASALERFYEFFWRVVMHQRQVPDEQIAISWRNLSKQSERQLGAYVTAYTSLTRQAPILLGQQDEVSFRNKVIHAGYVPSEDEAVKFGESVKKIISNGIDVLKEATPIALDETYERLSPRGQQRNSDDEDEIVLVINILTAIDVRHPPKEGDIRLGGVIEQKERILKERQRNRLRLSKKPFK